MSVTKIYNTKVYTVFHKRMPIFQILIFIEWYKSETYEYKTLWLTTKSEILFIATFQKISIGNANA
jgi:hypothetical protein